jgi:hypothetical protein
MPTFDPAADAAKTAIDHDLHGIVGVRLLGATATDAAALAGQLGPAVASLERSPDLVIRFVPTLPAQDMKLLGINKNGYTRDAFFLFRSGKWPARISVDFGKFGAPCEIVCESGLAAIPSLAHMVHLLMLEKNHVALHASAFEYRGAGILVAGWAKGGKSEALLAFALHGAHYVGDEWMFLRRDGERMYGMPQDILLWDWQVSQLTNHDDLVGRESKRLFRAIHFILNLHRWLSNSWIGKLAPVRYLGKALPALRRQLNITASPAKIFEGRIGPLHASLDKVFLMVSHESPDTHIEPMDGAEIAARMSASMAYEHIPLMENYYAYKFAFPDRANDLFEDAGRQQATLLAEALGGKEGYVVYHPNPCSFEELFKAMEPYCNDG